MTASEFNEKYDAFLEPGHYGMALSGPAVEFMDVLFDKWSKLPGFRYSQIKSKFGHARIYVDGVPEYDVSYAEAELTKIL